MGLACGAAWAGAKGVASWAGALRCWSGRVRAGAWEQAREEGKRAALEKGKRRRVGPLAGLPGLRWAAVGWFG